MSLARGKRIAWIVPSPTQASGGLRTIFQCIEALERIGAECTIFIMPTAPVDIDNIHSSIESWYGYDFKSYRLAAEIDDAYDVVVATFWPTAYAAYAAPIPCKIYFCQDFEPFFYSIGDYHFEAERSYRLGLQPVCLGRWLAGKVSTSGSKKAFSYDFGADSNVYFPIVCEKEYAICAIFQPEKPRRLSKFLTDIIRSLNRLNPGLTVYVYGSEGTDDMLEGLDVCNLGLLTPAECNALYGLCLAGISLSCTNPSRIPFEMMAAGLPVIELDLENNRDDIPVSAVKFAPYDPEAFAEAVINIVDSESLRDEMSQAGVSFMAERNVQAEDRAFVDAFERAMTTNLSNTDSVIFSEEQRFEKQNIMNRTRRLCEELTCFRCKWISLEVKNLPEGIEGVIIYIWSKDEQEDIVTSDFRSTGIEDNCLGCKLPEGLVEPTLCKIHVHAIVDGVPVVLFGFEHAFVTLDNRSIGRARTVESNGIVCRMEAL